MSGEVFVRQQLPHMTAGIGQRPFDFFKVLNEHGYATGNKQYPLLMTAMGKRGPYTLMRACTGQP
jgi:hypothetical protein